MNNPDHLSPEVLRLLRCPVTGSALGKLSAEELADWNQRILARKVSSRNGSPVLHPLDGGLVNASRSLVVPVRQGIVQMVDEHLLPVDQPE